MAHGFSEPTLFILHNARQTDRKQYLLNGNILLEQPDFPRYQLTLRHRLTLFSPTVETRQLWASSDKLVMMDRTFCRGLDCSSHLKE